MPKGVNIYDFVTLEGEGKEPLVFSYDERGYLNLYDENSITSYYESLRIELQNYVKKTTAPYKYPRKIEFVKELPKTISGKIKRKDLRETEMKRFEEEKKNGSGGHP